MIVDGFISLCAGACVSCVAAMVVGEQRVKVWLAIGVVAVLLMFVRLKTLCPWGFPMEGTTVQCMEEPYLDGTETRLERYWKRLHRADNWTLL
jgi:hypothetical protein